MRLSMLGGDSLGPSGRVSWKWAMRTAVKFNVDAGRRIYRVGLYARDETGRYWYAVIPIEVEGS